MPHTRNVESSTDDLYMPHADLTLSTYSATLSKELGNRTGGIVS